MDTKRITRIIAMVLAAVLLLGLIVTPALASATTEDERSSIGIIGSADGPTAIFVTTSPSGIISTILLIAGAICAVIAVVSIIKKRKK